MKHTIESVTKQARELAGALPITRDNYRQLAARIWGHDATHENRPCDITRNFTRPQLNAWFDECVLSLTEGDEVRRLTARTIAGRAPDWLPQAVGCVLLWQKNAALMPLTRAFAARLKEEMT